MTQNTFTIQLDLSKLGLLEIIDQKVNEKITELSNPTAPVVIYDSILTRKEAAQYLKISLPTLHKRTKSGEIPAYRLSGRVLYKQEDFISILKPIKLPNF